MAPSHGLRLMHSSLAMPPEGQPLDTDSGEILDKEKVQEHGAQLKKINPTRVPIEEKESVRWLDNFSQSIERLGQPERCIQIGDRDSDIYKLYCLTQDLGAHFLVRRHTFADEMEKTSVKGLQHFEVRDDKGEMIKAILEIKFKCITVLPPIGKQKRNPAPSLTVIHVSERGGLLHSQLARPLADNAQPYDTGCVAEGAVY